MAPRVPLPLGFTFYQSVSKPFSSQRCINWIPTVAEGTSLSNMMLQQPYGLKSFTDTGLGANRGGLVMKDVPYHIQGTSLVSTSLNGTVTNHGTIPGGGRVSLATNGQYLVIVIPGNSAYAYDNEALTLTQITDPDFQISDTVVFKDGFFVFSATDGQQFFVSNLNDPFNFDALDFGTAEIDADRIVALHVNHNELFVAGSDTIELQQRQTSDTAGFPFIRIQGANIQKGVHAKFSLVEFDNTFCFVGGGLNELSAVWKVTGSSSVGKISSDAIDAQIQKFTRDEIADSFAMTLAVNGQFLAVFTFESERIPSRTFVYNATASALSQQKVWFELQSGLEEAGNRWNVQSIVAAHGKLLVGDSVSGVIGELDADTFTYYGDAMLRQMVTAPFSADGLPIFAGLFEATFQAGVGLTAGQGNEPVALMDASDNGSHSFKWETRRKIGAKGEYKDRSVWERQGRFPVSRSVRLTVTDPVKANLIKLAATPEIGVQ